MPGLLGRTALRSRCLTLLCAMAIALAALGPATTASAQTSSLLGTWTLVWQGAQDNYTGTLTVTSKMSNTLFVGRLNLVKSNGAVVSEDASLAVAGQEVRILCSNPSVTPWNPDRFYVVRNGVRMTGYSLDTAGQRGPAIVFTKR
ncbi:MAG: hypothetical protein ACLPSW_22100 [Roseiarcus sp.]